MSQGTDGPDTGPVDSDVFRAVVREGVSKLQGLDVGDEFQVLVLSELVDGSRTISELVESIYGVNRSEEGFGSAYTRVRRTIKRLESRGLVSTRMFGKEKPYRLTGLAVMNLARIGGKIPQVGIISKNDLVIYIATILLAFPVVGLGLGWLSLRDPFVILLFACFFYLLGISTSKVIRTIMRVY